MKTILTLLLTLTLLLPTSAKTTTHKENKENSPQKTQLQTGDIIFTNGVGIQAQAVKAATESPWTHTAVIIIQDGKPMVLEAVQPVQFIPLKKYLARGGGKNTHTYKRLKDTSKLTPQALTKAKSWAAKHIGSDYDGKFQWSDNNLYCSELVWKIFQISTGIELCKTRQVKDYNLQHPNVKALIKARFGSPERLKKDEKIVAPSDIYNSGLLTEITIKK